jgi:hypothetical protein
MENEIEKKIEQQKLREALQDRQSEIILQQGEKFLRNRKKANRHSKSPASFENVTPLKKRDLTSSSEEEEVSEPRTERTTVEDIEVSFVNKQYFLTEILHPFVKNFHAAGAVPVLGFKTIASASPENRKQIQEWIDLLYAQEESFRIRSLNDPRKAIRSSKEALATCMDKMVWHFVLNTAEREGREKPSSSLELPGFITQEILRMRESLYQEDVVDRDDVDIIDQARKEIVWHEDGAPWNNFVYLLTEIKFWCDTNAVFQHLGEKEILSIIFNIIPFNMANYFLHRFEKSRSFVRGSRNGKNGSPFEKLDLGFGNEFQEFVDSEERVTDVIIEELKYLHHHMGPSLDFTKMYGYKTSTPNRSLNLSMAHLFPIQRKKVAAQVKAVGVVTPNKKKISFEKGKKGWVTPKAKDGPQAKDGPSSAKKSKHAGACWNCKSEAHSAKDCKVQCRKCPLDVSKFDTKQLHLFFECPKREVATK